MEAVRTDRLVAFLFQGYPHVLSQLDGERGLASTFFDLFYLLLTEKG